MGDLRDQWRGLIGFAAAHPGNDHIDQPLREHAHARASAAHPEHAAQLDAITRSGQHARAAATAWREISAQQSRRASPDDRLATPDAIQRMQQLLGENERQAEHAEQRLAALGADPAVLSRPDPAGWLARQHALWQRDREERDDAAELVHAARQVAQHAGFRTVEPWHPTPDINRGPRLGR